MQDLENRYIEIRVFEETYPEPVAEKKQKRREREPIGPKVQAFVNEVSEFGASVFETLKKSAEENRARVEMIQLQRREEYRRKRAAHKARWEAMCRQHKLGVVGDADRFAEDLIQDIFGGLGMGGKKKRKGK
ncbi:MAG: hypothetical protein R3B47_17845 [Bacteroidia bacterium]